MSEKEIQPDLSATTTVATLHTPFAELLPPLSSAELDALRQRISDEGGVHDPVLVTEDGVVLDGHNRLTIEPDAPTKTIPGSGEWSEAQQRAFVLRANRGRRNLSHDQHKDVERTSKKLALELKKEGKTQKQIGDMLGVSQQRVGKWLERITSPPSNGFHGSVLDCRVKVPTKIKPVIAARIANGESHRQVAADLGVSHTHVSRIVNEQQRRNQQQLDRQKAAQERHGDNGIICGDFRDHPHNEAFDLVFTDPPYLIDDLPLYSDLAKWAASALVPGGFLITYAGNYALPQVFESLSVDGLKYGWTFCIQHAGGDARFRTFRLFQGWKPAIAFYKPPLSVHWEWFRDVACGEGRNKSLHPWQQAEGEARYFITHLCPVGGIVADPFAGSGTTLAAAKKLGRRWWGCEIDPEHAETERCRLDQDQE